MSNDVNYIGRTIDLMGRSEPPIATCPKCGPGEPLVFTFDRAYYEFHCMTCQGWFGFLDPRPAERTDELSALTDQRAAEYKLSKEAH